ncbi:hypothetical protein NLI96_g1921 [Meripilus lineatus]|uniref:Carbonic anhydrase n=1 Tax=Meripilus lineatus TaxID=2056292 RepID=A0AAD5V9P0_9APHY|nr:hypothetical protein NLI96_g1921 [Physisporinus lineatus]
MSHQKDTSLLHVLQRNEKWAADVEDSHKGFFKTLAKSQSPKILWIGCADSRVPESVLTASMPGEIFVHRNIANQFHLHDDNAQSVLDYAVHHLKVDHVVVVGHTNCGGAAACLDAALAPPTDSESPLLRWLGPLAELARSFAPNPNREEALQALVEANVAAQVEKVAKTEVIRHAWHEGHKVQIHGWLFKLGDGQLKDLGIAVGPEAHHH